MPSVCLTFQVHQPLRLRPFSYFQVGGTHDYFDSANRESLRQVVERVYLPANAAVGELIARHQGRFRVAYSISGTAIEQLLRYAPDAIESFVALADTGAVEFLAETYHHSLASMYDADEFRAQALQHAAQIESLFGRRPRIFRNTGLIYSDRIGALVEGLGFQAVVAEAAGETLGARSPHRVYRRPGGKLRLLLTDHRLSDALRSGLSAGAAASPAADGIGEVVNLSVDYGIFGDDRRARGPSDLADRMDALLRIPDAILGSLGQAARDYLTPSQVIERYEPAGELAFRRPSAWADDAGDPGAWLGNHMQQGALRRLYDLGPRVQACGSPVAVDLWRKLQTADHFLYMSTAGMSRAPASSGTSGAAEAQPAGGNPYPSPYDAFINYMNVVTDLTSMVSTPSVDDLT